MNKRYYLQVFYLLAVLSILLCIPSCTYDYFEDETNFEVYVPKVDKSKRTETYCIEDLSIYIYNEGLKKEKYSCSPFKENARSIAGNFNFRLYPGSYSVFCFTNVQKTIFQDLTLFAEAKFQLQQAEDGFYEEPLPIYAEYKTPTIHFPGPVVSDTVLFDRMYVGRICIAFKNLVKQDPTLTYNNIKKIEIEASGVGVVQYLSALTDSVSTRSSRKDRSDIMRLTSQLFNPQYKDFEFGIQNYYFPSPDLTGEDNIKEPIVLKLNFIGLSDKVISVFTIPFTDKTGNPIVLHMNETYVIEVDGDNIQILQLKDLEDWNSTIEQEENSGPGSGGIGV